MVTYKDAGVDVERGYEAARRMKQHVATTFDENVLGGLGSFGGFYSIENAGVDKPVLVAGTDGVGTKLKLAFLMDKQDVYKRQDYDRLTLEVWTDGSIQPDEAISTAAKILNGHLKLFMDLTDQVRCV